MRIESAMTARQEDHDGPACMSRRAFLLSGGLAVTMVTLGAIPGLGWGAGKVVIKVNYPRVKIGTLSGLRNGSPVEFAYPFPDVSNILVKLGAPAAGGVGPQQDVVAFNQQCTHMGNSLRGTYRQDHQVFGPCPKHLTVFDLTRHGMVVSGHATESLPQIMLETVGNDIYAVGVLGLVFGHSGDFVAPPIA